MQTIARNPEWSTEKLMDLPRDGRKYELIGGEVSLSPTGFQHGYISSRLVAVLLDYALRHKLGLVVDSSTGFRLKNGDCLSPDVSFVRKNRLLNGITQHFFDAAPDLVVEVLSPGESATSLNRKLTAYFGEGTCLAWVVNIKQRTVRVYRSPKRYRSLAGLDALDGEDLLPGLTFPVAELFKVPDFHSE